MSDVGCQEDLAREEETLERDVGWTQCGAGPWLLTWWSDCQEWAE